MKEVKPGELGGCVNLRLGNIKKNGQNNLGIHLQLRGVVMEACRKCKNKNAEHMHRKFCPLSLSHHTVGTCEAVVLN